MARHGLEATWRDTDPDWAAVRPEASGFADPTVRVLRSATILGIAAREVEDLLVAAGADLTDMGDPRVTWFTVASAAIVRVLRDFEAEAVSRGSWTGMKGDTTGKLFTWATSRLIRCPSQPRDSRAAS